MGNRAVLTFDTFSKKGLGIYLHWNGGRDSVEGFLEATKQVMGGRLGDSSYGRARLLGVINTFMAGNLSLGMGACEQLDCDNYDNGVYIIDSEKMEIKGRKFFDNKAEQSTHNVKEFAQDIMDKIKIADNYEQYMEVKDENPINDS